MTGCYYCFFLPFAPLTYISIAVLFVVGVSSFLFESTVLFPNYDGVIVLLPVGVLMNGLEDLCFLTLIVTGIFSPPLFKPYILFGDMDEDTAFVALSALPFL